MKDNEYYEIGGMKIPKVKYYKAENNNFVEKDKGRFYVVRKGELVFEPYWGKIQLGDIEAEEITEEEFNEALEKSKDGEEGYL